jgi:7-cyano-7-deazaguanine synthase
MKKKAIVLLSGGMDSTTLLYELLRSGYDVAALGINYGQRHVRELESAAAVAARAGVEYKLLDLSSVKDFLAGSSQTSDIDVPEGHYADESMRITVVPNRNMILLSCAIGWAVSRNATVVAYAAHAGDHAIYPDCRLPFINALGEAAKLCHFYPVELFAPFASISKTDICRRGFQLEVPYELTWSCYKGLDKHCGKCGTCTERREAFRDAGIVTDPTTYETA